MPAAFPAPAAAAAPAISAAAGLAALLALLADATPGARAADALGDAEHGAELFADCAGCHDIGEGARNRVGPLLNGVFGRRAAGLESYEYYSEDMRRAGADGLVWDAEKLDIYITDPHLLVTGTRMSYGGMEDHDDRADLIAYLRRFSDDPGDIPEAAPTARARDPDVHPDVLAIEGDPEYGAYLAGECVTCHQASGADDGIPSITGWPVKDFVTAMHAYKARYRPHPVMRMVAGRLSEEEIAALAAYFNGAR